MRICCQHVGYLFNDYLADSHVSLSTLDSADLRTCSEDQNTLEEQVKGKKYFFAIL